MDWKLPDNSLFAILMRARWWVSLLVGLGAFGLTRLFLPESVAAFAALPFAVIAVVAAWKQRRMPTGAKFEAALEKLRAMNWDEFSRELEAGFKREGYGVKRAGGAADFELEKAGLRSVVAARRWKASGTGIEPLKELLAAGEARGAAEHVYVLEGELSDNARKFVEKSKIKLMRGPDIVKLTAQ